jgi:ribosomal protein S18 acetylase RimI-like enzyme
VFFNLDGGQKGPMETDFSVQLAEPADARCLATMATELRQELGEESPSLTEFLVRIEGLLHDPNTDYLVARDNDGRCLAFLQQRYRRSIWSEGEEANLEDLFVAAASRSLGLGTRLVELAVERARARGCAVVTLDTNERNLKAIALYERLGFRFSFTHVQTEMTGGREVLLDKPLA